MPTLYYDVETQGLPPRGYGAPIEAWPHIVQLGAVLADGEQELEVIDTLVLPDGWTIPEQVVAIHGITTERCAAEGRPIADVMADLIRLADAADLVVAHNRKFDHLMVKVALRRLFPTPEGEEEPADGPRARWRSKAGLCTMEAMTPICRLPATQKMVRAGFDKFKAPKLIEAYRHCFGEDFEGAHDALTDVRACMRVHRWLMENEGRIAA